MTTQIGVIADTHGLLRPEAIDALEGSGLIIHAGDVGVPEVLEALTRIAPVVAVRGNVDTAPWTAALAATEVVTSTPSTAGFAAVIYGHSHRPFSETRRGVLHLNPGSAGPRRFSLPVTVVRLRLTDAALEPEFVHLETPRDA